MSDIYGYSGKPWDCPHCGAVSPDYCSQHECEWTDAEIESMRGPDAPRLPKNRPPGGRSRSAGIAERSGR